MRDIQRPMHGVEAAIGTTLCDSQRLARTTCKHRSNDLFVQGSLFNQGLYVISLTVVTNPSCFRNGVEVGSWHIVSLYSRWYLHILTAFGH